MAKGRFVSPWYLISFTVVLMLLIFALEDIVFPSKCSSCAERSDLSTIGISSNMNKFSIEGQFKEVHLQNLDDTRDDATLEVTRSIHKHLESDKISERRMIAKGQVEGEDGYRQEVSGSSSENIGLEEGAVKSQVGARAFREDAVVEGSHSLGTRTLDTGSFVEDRDNVGTRREDESEELGKGLEGQVEGHKSLQLPTSKNPEDKRHSVALETEPPVWSPPVNSVWYYTKVYKHPEAKLRPLNAVDGAARLRSTFPRREREITIVTQTSADRLQAVEATCMTWGGPLCVAVHVRLQSEIARVYELVKHMHSRVEQSGRCFLEIQLVTEDGFQSDEEALQALYPVNALRNVALRMSTTKLVFLLDADFIPSPGLHEKLTEGKTYHEILRMATEEQQLFVVPAFEAVYSQHITGYVSVPNSKEELKEGWKNGNVSCFHCVKSPTGHMPTNFQKFFDPATTSPYSIPYRQGFEPYVIGAVDSIPLYDARFRGYGENKVSHIFSCAVVGMGFQVLPDAFVFELPHPPSAAHESYIGKHKDPVQRYRIIGLYKQFNYELEQREKAKDPVRYGKFLEGLKKQVLDNDTRVQ